MSKGKIIKEYFSLAKIALIKECKEHPVLMMNLASCDANDWPGAIGEIAAYCHVYMDGKYMPCELERLYETLIFKLKGKRAMIVNTVMESKNG